MQCVAIHKQCTGESKIDEIFSSMWSLDQRSLNDLDKFLYFNNCVKNFIHVDRALKQRGAVRGLEVLPHINIFLF